jgi:hypothetical protein
MSESRYMNFTEDGTQASSILSETNPGEGWYKIEEEIEGKLFKLVNGQVVALTDTQKEAYIQELRTDAAYLTLRRERDELLMKSDWTQLSNSNLTEAKAAEWETYRQALRDLPETMTEDLTYTLPESPV